MKVLFVPVLERPSVISITTLEDMQDLVGGWIGCVYPWEDKIGLVHNDNGIAEGCVPNRYLWESKNIIFGDFFLAGLSEDDFCSLPEKLIEFYSRRFAAPEVIMITEEGFTVTQFYRSEDLFL